jgi:hypothetical protein
MQVDLLPRRQYRCTKNSASQAADMAACAATTGVSEPLRALVPKPDGANPKTATIIVQIAIATKSGDRRESCATRRSSNHAFSYL